MREKDNRNLGMILFVVVIGIVVLGMVVISMLLFRENRELKRENESLTKEYNRAVEKEKNENFVSENKTSSSADTDSEAVSFSTEDQRKETQNQEIEKKIVAIDPGHQGWDVDMSDLEPIAPGASEKKAKATSGTEGAYTNLPEFQLNLDVSLKLRQELEERGYEVILTREDNQTAISNSQRAQMAAEGGAEVFVRIHADGEDGGHSASGASALISTPDNPYVGELYESSKKLAEEVLRGYCEATGFKNRQIMEVDNMSGINWSQVPVIILEMGFMSNENDDRYMADSNNQTKMAKGIANGIDAYFEADTVEE